MFNTAHLGGGRSYIATGKLARYTDIGIFIFYAFLKGNKGIKKVCWIQHIWINIGILPNIFI